MALTIGHRSVAAGVRDSSATSAADAARRVLGDLRGEGALHGHVLLARDLQNGRPWSGVGNSAVGRLVVVGVLQSALLGAARSAVRVGHALAPALEVGAEGSIHGDLDDHQQNAQRDREHHQAAVRPPVPFLHSPQRRQQNHPKYVSLDSARSQSSSKNVLAKVNVGVSAA